MKYYSRFLIISLLVFQSVAGAASCPPTAKKNLQLAYPATPNLKDPVDVQFEIVDDNLLARFEVRNPSLHAKPVLGPKEYPYQFDVVEVFLSVGGPGKLFPYYEFEVSPYNQTLQVRVDDLKKPFVNNIEMGLQSSAERTATGWKGILNIPLRNLGWDGDATKIVGNAYAILGKSPKRNYWGLTLPVQVKPNFHKPEFFRSLISCP